MANGTIFVTGGAGFIGSRLVKLLVERGYPVCCLLRNTTNTRRLEGLPVEKRIGDVTDFVSLVEGSKGCSGILHLAGLSNWKDIKSPKMPAIVIGGTKNVLDAAATNGNIKTLFVSSSTAIDETDDAVLLNENSPFTLPRNKHYVYAHAKNDAEKLCMQRAASGQPVTIVNPAEVYGPFDYDKITCGNLLDFVTTKTVQVPLGGTSIVHVEDVAGGILAAFEKGQSGERYILGGDNLEIEVLAKTTLEILGIKKPVKVLGRKTLMTLAWISQTFHIPMGFEPAVVPYAIKYFFMDNTKAKKELGITFRGKKEVLESTLNWMVNEGMIKRK